jgi:predicted homoserine dehydrogenase-like protein
MGSKSYVEVGAQKRVEHLPSISTYTYQLIAFADAVDLGKPVKTDAKDALIQAQLIDSAYEAAGLPLRPTFNI